MSWPSNGGLVLPRNYSLQHYERDETCVAVEISPNVIASLEAWDRNPRAQGKKQEAIDYIKKVISSTPITDPVNLNLSQLDLNMLPPLDVFGDYLKEVDISHNLLEDFPEELESFRNLLSLDISHNRLEHLPESLIRCQRLTNLNLAHNTLRALPHNIGALSTLQELDVRSNQLESLPQTIGDLSELTSLIVPCNHLKELPSSMGNLKKLKNFYAQSNQLTTLPDDFFDITELETLCLGDEEGGNKISILSPKIACLTELRLLYLAHNDLTQLPDEVGNLKQLRSLNLDNNPNLESFPSSLARILGLYDIRTSKTKISLDHHCQYRCQQKRFKNLSLLPERLSNWKALSKSESDLSRLDSFEEHDRIDISIWLAHVKESATRYCRYEEKDLKPVALTVCRILETAHQDPEFKKKILTKIKERTLDCLNEEALDYSKGQYSSGERPLHFLQLCEFFSKWIIHRVSLQAPSADQIKILVSEAKMIALRTFVASQIAIEAKANHKMAYKYPVEVMLTYENFLKDSLNLNSLLPISSQRQVKDVFIDNYHHKWIEPSKVAEEVGRTYVDVLLSLPELKVILSNDPIFQDFWQSIERPLNLKLEALQTIVSESDNLSPEEKAKIEVALKSCEEELKTVWLTAARNWLDKRV